MAIIFCMLMGIPAFAQFDAYIDNGDAVAAADALTRSVARLKLNGGGTCSASFLTDKVLLTAGHCTSKGAHGAKVEVRDANGAWHSVAVEKMTAHPDYEISESNGGTRVNHDIALVRIRQGFSFPVRPLKIRSASKLKSEPANVTIVGYGLDGQGGKSGTLRKGTMRASIEPLTNFNGREGLFLTVNTEGQILCPGDSGGAVLGGPASSTSLIGVNSLSSGCKGFTGRSMSELTWAHAEWIRQTEPSVP